MQLKQLHFSNISELFLIGKYHFLMKIITESYFVISRFNEVDRLGFTLLEIPIRTLIYKKRRIMYYT